MLDLQSLWYDLWYAGSALFYTAAFSTRTAGMHHMPATGPVLVVANHQSFIDPILVGLVVRRRLRFLARKSLYRNRILATMLPTLNTYPVDQEGFAREGLLAVINLLHAGHAALIFPEGERCWNGTMQALRPGVHLLIKKAPCPIVPVGIAGAFEAWPRTRTLPKFSPPFWPANHACVAAVAGKPLEGSLLAKQPREVVLATLFDSIQEVQHRAELLRRK